MELETVAIAKLSVDPANVRKHDDRNIGSIISSLTAFGQQKPIVVDSDDVVVAGSGTLDAFQVLGWGDVVIVRTELKGSRRAAYAIADNRSAELAAWDEQLADVLTSLKVADAELFAATGFTDAELEAMSGVFDVGDFDLPDSTASDATFEGITFQLSSSQAETVRRAISMAAHRCGEGGNANANAITFICEGFLDES